MAGVFPTAASPTGTSTPPLPPSGGTGNFPSVSLSNEYVKVRFFEESAADAVNKRWIGMPRGVYLGFVPTALPSSRTLSLDVDPDHNFSLLKVPSSVDRVMVDVFTNASVTLDFTGHNVWPVYVLATTTYQDRVPTQGKIFTRASPASSIDEIGICRVDKVGDDLIIDVTEPTFRQQPVAFNDQPYGYMPDNSIENLAATTATVSEIITARNSSFTGANATLGGRLDADMAGSAMGARLGLRAIHVISNIHPDRSGSSINVSGSFSETGRDFAPILSIDPNGDETTEGAITASGRNYCLIVNGDTGQRLIDDTTRNPVYGELTFSTATIGGGKTVNFTNASVAVTGGGSNPFTAPLLEGDLLEGPDGLFYEIEDIVDPDNATLGAAFQGTSGSITDSTLKRWLVFLFTVTGGVYNLSTATPVQFIFPCFFRLDRAVFDGMLLIKKDGERPQLPLATETTAGKALLAIDGGLVGSFRTIKNAGGAIGNDIHTWNFINGGATNAGGGVVNVSVPGTKGPDGTGANQGAQGPSGAAGFGYSVNNTFEAGPESGDTATAVGPVTVSFTFDWTASSPVFASIAPRSYAHVSGGWSVINGFGPGFERIHIDDLTDVDQDNTRIVYRIEPAANLSLTTIQCFMGASQ